jgi:squalene-hopene/tetraprenyl-beta-curcumene cyclase
MDSIRCWSAALALVLLTMPLGAQGKAPGRAPKQPDNPFPYNASEPGAKVHSLARSAEYLDGVARFWTQKNSCGACHANFAYLMARPLLDDSPTPLVAQTRQFLETRKQENQFTTPMNIFSPSEAVAVAFALSWHDAHTTRTLQPTTRKALGRMWALQRPNGTWGKLGCGSFLPAENDFYYTACLAALATGVAKGGYAQTTEARDGLTRVRRYLTLTHAPNPHHRAMLLWASMHVDGLLTTAERAETVQNLLARQGKDGGWSLASLAPEEGATAHTGSDGYGTAFVVYVLRQAGVPARQPALVRGVQWLQRNQRASGRWFTPSPLAGHATEGGVGARDLYIQSMGTAFAVLALKACDEPDRIQATTQLSP